MTKENFSKCVSQDKYKKLLFALCFFHSVLIERKKFQNLGWNVVYSFNDSDFEVIIMALTLIARKILDIFIRITLRTNNQNTRFLYR